MVEQPSWVDERELRETTFVAGYGLSRAVADRRIDPLPVRLSAIPSVLANRPPDVAIVTGVPRGAGYALTSSVG